MNWLDTNITRSAEMISRPSLDRMLNQLYHRRADLEGLIRFFERYGKTARARNSRLKRALRAGARLAAAN